jgi:hypothetical protein
MGLNTMEEDLLSLLPLPSEWRDVCPDPPSYLEENKCNKVKYNKGTTS